MTLHDLTFDDIGNLQVDDDGLLYWKGKPVAVEKRLTLEGYQIFLASVATAATVISAVIPFGQFFKWW